MAQNYKCIAPATGLEVGKEYSEAQINALPGMGGVDRLLDLKAIAPGAVTADPIPAPVVAPAQVSPAPAADPAPSEPAPAPAPAAGGKKGK